MCAHKNYELGEPKKLGKIDRLTGERIARGNHAAMSYKQVPALMAKLAATPGLPSLALQITILTCARTSETLGMTFDKIDFEEATWSIPASRMKMKKLHRVPLSPPALAILRAQAAERGDSENRHVFPGRPMKPLSNMSMAMLLRRSATAMSRCMDFAPHSATGRPRSTRPSTRPPSDASRTRWAIAPRSPTTAATGSNCEDPSWPSGRNS